jgi:hypothetical protein
MGLPVKGFFLAHAISHVYFLPVEKNKQITIILDWGLLGYTTVNWFLFIQVF